MFRPPGVSWKIQDGPSVLVGHSYGGMVITDAGNAKNVAGLVYIAAFQPDQGESLVKLAQGKPVPNMRKDSLQATKDRILLPQSRGVSGAFRRRLAKG